MNTDWAQVIINSAILLTYFFMLISNNKMVRKTKEMVEETKIAREQAYRPEVIAYVREENEFLYFRVHNVGLRPAFNIHIQIKNYFYNTEHEGILKEYEMFFKQIPNTIRDIEKNIHLLAPGQCIESYMGLREFIVKRNLNVERNVRITYTNYEGGMYLEEYTLSTDDFTKKSYFKRDNLEEISSELNKISNIMNKTEGFSKRH